MQNHVEKILLVLIIGEFVTGVLGNGFMVLVNCIDWVKSKKLSTVDLILVVLGISRIGLLCLIKWDSFLFLFFLDQTDDEHQNFIRDLFWIITHLSSVWFATSLSIFYLLKIANFSHPFFLWLKWRINQVVYILLVGPLFVYVSYQSIKLVELYSDRTLSRRENERNESQAVQMNRKHYFIEEVGINILNIPPFILSIISCFLLLYSLWKHSQKMQLKVKTSRDPSTEAHKRAMKAMLSFLILIIVYHIGILFTYKNFSKLTSMFGMALMSLYPTGHSLILILWNSKLKHAALLVWRQLKCCLKLNKSSNV
ncbi:bitter taste receptor Modo-T2R24 [Monodelphis domestica]|uniref:Taste receptor type 2 n=1 Tax=Monodelphis domestica TaxID=13616 RepID=Q2AB95_MONDO|nr:bitter taste receptor Modo-T2R24 [Monodelphis domestica]BAE80372.1 bitter taste receptor [Monodelphis domestica]